MCLFSIDNVRNSSTGSPDRVDALVWGLTEVFDKIVGRRRHGPTTNQEAVQQQNSWDPGFMYNNNPQGWMV
jgi:hypothetical protein